MKTQSEPAAAARRSGRGRRRLVPRRSGRVRVRLAALVAGAAMVGAALFVGGGRSATLVVLPGGAKTAAAVLRHAGLHPAVDTHGSSDALLLGNGGTPREAIGVVPGPSGASALYVAPLHGSQGGAPAAASGPRRVIGGRSLGVADVADAGGYLAIALGSGGQVSAVRIQRGLGPTVAVFALRPPARSVALRADSARRAGLRVRWTATGGSVGRAVLYQGRDGWRSTSTRLRLQKPPTPRHNAFIHLVEWVRATFGGRPVALAEDVWYHLTDFVRRHLYALVHGVPAANAGAASGAAAQGSTGQQASAARGGASSAPPASSTARAAARQGTPSSGGGGATAPHLPSNLRIPSGYPQAQGEGVWVPTGPSVGGQAVMARTFVLPDPQRPYERVDLVWMDTRLLNLHLVAGTAHPKAASGVRGSGVIPVSARGRLVAAFNGGFKKYAGHYGSFGYRAAGVWYRTPVNGLATLAVYPDHHAVIGAWGGQRLPASPAPWSLLQNLRLLINHGQISPNISQGGLWGMTVGNSVRVWRSGLAQTASGNLIYAAGIPVTAHTLARVFALAGARQAMQLDINSYWVTFNLYHATSPGANTVVGTKLMPNMVRPADRYLTPDRRDFVYLTLPRALSPQGAG